MRSVVCVFFLLPVACSMLPVSLNYPSLTAASVFSNVYFGSAYQNLEFQKHVNITKNKLILPQALATLAKFGYSD